MHSKDSSAWSSEIPKFSYINLLSCLLGVLHTCCVLSLFSPPCGMYLPSLSFNDQQRTSKTMHKALEIQAGGRWRRVTSQLNQRNNIQVIIKYPYFTCPCSSPSWASPSLDIALCSQFLLVPSCPNSISPPTLSPSWVSNSKNKILCVFLLSQESTEECFSIDPKWPSID